MENTENYYGDYEVKSIDDNGMVLLTPKNPSKGFTIPRPPEERA